MINNGFILKKMVFDEKKYYLLKKIVYKKKIISFLNNHKFI